MVTPCIIFCLLNCRLLTWDPVPDADLSHYLITGPGLAVQTTATSYVLPHGWEDQRICVVAVDMAGNQSAEPACLDGGPRRMEWGFACGLECSYCTEWEGDRCRRREPIPGVECCKQPVCGVSP